MDINNTKIAVIGLGYVGLPLAVAFAEKYRVIGFDIKKERVQELNNGIDRTLEVENEELQKVLIKDPNSKTGLLCTDDIEHLKDCNFYIMSVPTPIDQNKNPVITPLLKASEIVGKVLSKGDVVVYESTVYPGCTEEDCVPILKKVSGLKYNEDFHVGYSPERINPGDKERTVTKILKVTSGSTPEAADYIDDVYKSVIKAGTFKAASIKVAEAAKVIENSQRDINIAFVNELSIIFARLGIDTHAVLEAAGTKWNFLPFKPGLVGGHCIGVDPYYLAQKAKTVGYHPEIILGGRKINDDMGIFVTSELVKGMIAKDIKIKNAHVLVLGITFKENCPDIRNTRVIDVIDELKSYGIQVSVYDPWASAEEVKQEYGLDLRSDKALEEQYDGIILTVAHNEFQNLDYPSLRKSESVIYDVKGVLDTAVIDARL